MTKTLQILLCGLVVTAPWLCGAVTTRPQFYLALVLVPIALLRFVQRLFQNMESPPSGVPVVVIVGLAMLGIGVWQMVPSGASLPLESLDSVVMKDLVPGVNGSEEIHGFARGLHTVSPDSTQLALAQLCLAILALWLSFDLFEDGASRRWLYQIVGLNGAAIAAFGIAQKLTWNGMLFWSIPLRYGGSPFGPFVNRNNAAGYLLLAFACGAASLLTALFPFGLGGRHAPPSPLRSRVSQFLMRSLGRITPEVLIPFSVIAVIIVGILSSLSRAGVVGLVASTLVLIPAMRRWRTRLIVIITVMISLAYGALIWVGEDGRFAERIQTLGKFSKVAEGRLVHWQEVLPLVHDFQWTGAGWGTYSKVSPLYLTENDDRWFQHAENQYIEVLAEAGIAGLCLFVIGLLLFAYASARAIRSDQEGRILGAGIAGILSVIAMATVSLTDFSLAISSVLLTFLVIMGSVLASYARLVNVSRWILILRGSRLAHYLLQVSLLLGSGMAFYQLHFSSEIEQVVDLLPTDEELPQLSVDACDQILNRINALTIRHPRHPGLLNASGQLKIYRYRRLMYDDMLKQPQSQALQPRALWSLTHIERLDAIASDMRLRGDEAALNRLLESPEVRTNLPPALEDFKLSLKLDPLSRRTSLNSAWIAHLTNDPSKTVFRDLAMIVGASDSTALYQLGHLSDRMQQPEFNARCWNRCLMISETWAKEIWDEATQTRDEREALPILPDRLNVLLAISELSRDLSVRKELLDKCQKIASGMEDMPVRTRAQLETQLGNSELAAKAYQEAVREAPLDVELRLEASVALEKSGRLQDAMEMVEAAEAIAPKRQDIKKRLRELISTTSPAPSPRDVDNAPNARENR